MRLAERVGVDSTVSQPTVLGLRIRETDERVQSICTAADAYTMRTNNDLQHTTIISRKGTWIRHNGTSRRA
jgi:hypothetical protein